MNICSLNREIQSNGSLDLIPARIMVVDDDPIMGFILDGVLKRSGYRVDVFDDSRKAYEFFGSLEVDLVVIDWKMPGLDGLSLIDVFKEKSPDLPCILITSYGDAEVVGQALKMGRVDAVVCKPFDIHDFLVTLSSVLGHREIHPQSPAEIWIEVACDHTVSSNIIGVVDDWQVQASQGLYYKQILECIIDAVIVVNCEGCILYFNEGTKRMFGFNEEDASSLELSRLCGLTNPVQETLAQFFAPHPPVEKQCEGYFTKCNGDEFYGVFSASLLDSVYQEKAVVIVIKDIHERYIMEQNTSDKASDLEILATTDALTGQYNRFYFDRRLEEEYKRTIRYDSILTLIMLDFDHFKRVNDVFGHQMGDKVLVAAACELSWGLRDVDILARWGGEEFMVMLPETTLQTAMVVAKRLHSIILNSPTWASLDPKLQVTVSMGMVSYPARPGQKSSTTELLTCLDQALYKAKETGRNKIVYYNDSTGSFEDVCLSPEALGDSL